MPNILISLDPSLAALGYAVWDADAYSSNSPGSALLDYGVVNTTHGMSHHKRMGAHKDRACCLKAIYAGSRITVIAERQFYHVDMRNPEAVAQCQEVLGGWEFIFSDSTFLVVAPQTWQGALLSGFARSVKSKQRSLIRCEQLTRLSLKDHNASDAILIGIWQLDHQGFADRLREAV